MKHPGFAALRATYLESWPAGLARLSVDSVDLPLTLDEARALGSQIRGFGAAFAPPRSIEALGRRIDGALERFPAGAFVRLGSRSGKDSFAGEPRLSRVTSRQGALAMLTEGSERIAADLDLALRHRYPPHVFVREWVPIERWAELRCFVQGRRLVGVSQYDPGLGPLPELIENEAEIAACVQDLFDDARELLPLDDIVLDLFLERSSDGFTARLLELNPFSPSTGAGLFRWDLSLAGASDFDGSFRFRRS